MQYNPYAYPLKPYLLLDAPPVSHSTTVRSAHTVFMCFVFIWEQTATCATQHKLIGFYNRDEKCLQRGTDWGFK